jgi:hypothetical protein
MGLLFIKLGRLPAQALTRSLPYLSKGPILKRGSENRKEEKKK